MEKTKFIIIAGPQSSGKTTAFDHIKKRYPDAIFLEEINPYTFNKTHLGGAFVGKALEMKIVEEDLKRLESLTSACEKKKSNLAFIVQETGIFHLVYCEGLFEKRYLRRYYQKYLKIYNHFDVFVLFIDTKPSCSWSRRKYIYIERIKKLGIRKKKEKVVMPERYRRKIETLYPLWLRWYKKVPYKKTIIKNSKKDLPAFLKSIELFVKNVVG